MKLQDASVLLDLREGVSVPQNASVFVQLPINTWIYGLKSSHILAALLDCSNGWGIFLSQFPPKRGERPGARCWCWFIITMPLSEQDRLVLVDPSTHLMWGTRGPRVALPLSYMYVNMEVPMKREYWVTLFETPTFIDPTGAIGRLSSMYTFIFIA